MKFKNNFKEYTESGNVDFDQNTNAITFINKGTVAVTINNTITLSVNDTLSIGGNEGEIDFTTYNASFVPGGNNSLIVITKCYV
jgi:hypothetical protein